MDTIDTIIELPSGRPGARAAGRKVGSASMLRWLALGAMLVHVAGCASRECVDAGVHEESSLHGVRPATADPGLMVFLSRFEEALNGMLNDDPTLWLDLSSHSEEASFFPPFGGAERGWKQVEARYRAAAARRRRDAQVEIELIGSGVSGDLAYVVAIERSRFHLAGLDQVQSRFTRVTHILRREQGRWRLLHRHMDHLPEVFTPPADWPAVR